MRHEPELHPAVSAETIRRISEVYPQSILTKELFVTSVRQLTVDVNDGCRAVSFYCILMLFDLLHRVTKNEN